MKVNKEMTDVLEEEIQSALANFAQFHGVLTERCKQNDYTISCEIDGERVSHKIEKFDYLENIVERAIMGKDEKAVKSLVGAIRDGKNEQGLESLSYERLGYNSQLAPFLEQYNGFIKTHLSNAPFEAILHCDAYPTNVLEGGTIIDSKPLKRGNPMVDISHFLISPKIEGLNSSSDFLDSYLRCLLPDATSEKIGQLKETYPAHVIHNSICLVGAMLKQNNVEHARCFFNKAIDTMEELKLDDLKKSFIEYIKNSGYAKEKGLLMKIGVDFDGVISDSTRLKMQRAKENYGIELHPEHCSKGNAEKEGLSREDYEKMVREIYGTDLFLNAEEIPRAKRIIGKLVERGNGVYIITSRSGEEAGFAERWLANRRIPYTGLVNTNEQSKLPACKERGIEAFIDDTYEKLEELTGKGLSLYLFSNPANKAVRIESPDVKRADNWEELYGILKTHCKQGSIHIKNTFKKII